MSANGSIAQMLLAIGLAGLTPAAQAAEPASTAAEAKAFAKSADQELRRLFVRQAHAEWIKSTYITDDTEKNAAYANEDLMAFLSKAIPASMRFEAAPGLDAETRRMLHLLRLATPLPAPNDPAKREELAATAARLEGLYGKGKWCGKDGKARCRDLQELEEVLRRSRSWAELTEAWTGWRTLSPPMKPLYERLVALSNEGAREIGFEDVGELWRSGYDMSPAQFEAETDRLWQQVKPLYDDLHCYVRARLAGRYGKDKVDPAGPIPAQLLGNMWAQDWANIYPLVEPYSRAISLDVSEALKARKLDPIQMVKVGEGFYTSLGLDPLPTTFWERSQFVKPRGREVVCHASAWDLTFANDLRIKMCIRQTEEDLVTIHHELGHDYYFHAYYSLPVLFQQGANDGFHEAIGDAIALSITPGYLQKIGLFKAAPRGEQALINVQLKAALERIAFLPFGKLIDQWRWDVFSGKIAPSRYNEAWWALRLKYQGVAPPAPRAEADFDPGAKYHIPANVPYVRYFLARILQFQFHRALCRATGFQGPLHECSIYGNKEAGKRLQGLLALGASKPWPEALEALTGRRDMDATAILEYFAPLQSWLKKQNRGQRCGW